MFEKKLKAILVLSISFSLLLTQVAIAASVTATEGVTVTKVIVNAGELKQPVEVKKQEEIKTKISKDEAIKIVKSFKFCEGYDISNIYLENNQNTSKPIWRIELSATQYNPNASVSISADTGELVNYNSWTYQAYKKNIATITKKQAQEKVDKFFKDYVTTDTKSLEYVPGFNYAYEKMGGIYEVPQYQFVYALKVNGIIRSDANYNISVNASNGEIMNFNSPFEYLKDVKYPSTEGVKSLAQLKDKYISLLKMQLQYSITYDADKPKVYLSYIPTAGLLNAKTMEPISDYTGNGISQTIKYSPIDPNMKVKNEEITEAKAEEMMQEAKLYIENLIGIKFEDKQSMVRMSNKENTVSREFDLRTDNQIYGVSISLNLSSGNIINLSYYQYSNNYEKEKAKVFTKKVTYKDAKKKSDEIIKALFKKQYSTFSDNNQESDSLNEVNKLQPTHNFNYIRVENGIPVGNSISVNIDKETGKPTQIYMNWLDLDFPKHNVISEKNAKEAYLKDIKFGLEFYTPYIYSNGGMDRTGETVIVFKPSNNDIYRYISAENGEIVDYSGKQIKRTIPDENHWAANSIELLETQGIIMKNILSYDQKLSRQDAVKMLSLIMGLQNYVNIQTKKKDSFSDIDNSNEYYKYVESAVQNGIIQATGSSFKGTQEITKEEFIVMLIDMLGYKEIAKHSELFTYSSEINVNERYISICKALDILPVKSGDTFNAMDTITFAEAADSLYKALKYYR